MKDSPSEGDVLICGRFRCGGCVGVGAAIQKPDRLGFEFDRELLDDVLDGFLSGGHRDDAVVLACRKFALHEDVSALDQA